MPESITIIDNRNGSSVEIPIVDGGVSADGWRKLLPGVWFADPAFMTTAVTSSSITYLDGEAGVLRYRGYPIEQLAEHSTYLEVAYLLVHGELPNTTEYKQWTHDITYHTFIHENMRKRFLEGFHYDAHPMGMLVSAVGALSTFYLEAKDVYNPEVRAKQIMRLIAKMPTLAAACHRFSVGMPFVYPDNSLPFAENFLSMMWKVAEPRYEVDPVLSRALDVLFILHADHEQNCGTLALRTVASAHADPYMACAAGMRRPVRAAPRWCQRGSHPHAARHRLDRCRAGLHQVGQGRPWAADGLRPPGVQELRPTGPDREEDRRTTCSK